MSDQTQLSIIIPFYNEEENIELLYQALVPVLQRLNQLWEIVFVDDGSRDKSFEVVKKLSLQDNSIRAISLSRNFGHQVALTAGLQHARGSIVITLDADLQHPPEVIPLMLEKFREGFEIVNTRRIDSKETGYFKKQSSRFF
ncbi:MAG TPA: glycosyltransferase family 2 protein, partial [Bacteroidales bacterium]|nr:glycosyltransferase family 2 protein [Bacteroidales bacterium]